VLTDILTTPFPSFTASNALNLTKIEFSELTPPEKNPIVTQWNIERGLNGAALLNLYLTEVMENPAECRDR